MNFFVTGVGGQLGHDVMNELLKRGHEGVGSDIQETYSGVADGSAVTKAPYVALDITDKEAVEKVITEVNPDAVIHCAAWTAVDMAEDDDKVAKVRAINAGGTQNIADVCKKLDCKMTYISTDYVFDGQGTEPWQPDCKDYKPLNVYGQTKLEGELAVSQTLEKYFIVRIAWVFGLNGKNFIKTILNTTYQILILIVPLITTPYISRVLGAEGIGVYSYTYSVVSYFLIVAAMGTTTYGQRTIAYYQDDKYKRSCKFFEILLFRALTTGVCSIGYIWYLCSPYCQYNKVATIQIIYLIAIAFDISWLFQGLEDFKRIVLRNTIAKIFNVVLILTVVKQAGDVDKYTFILAGMTFVANISVWPYVPKIIQKVKLSDVKPLKNTREIFLLFIPTIAIQVNAVLDKTMIGGFAISAAENGYYEQTEKIVRMALAVVTSLGTVMIPRIAKLFHDKKTEQMRQYIQQSYQFVWIIGIPIMMGVMAIADTFVPVFYGSGYDKIKILLPIYSLSVIPVALSNVTGCQFLIPTKKQNVYSAAVLSSTVVNVTLNSFLIPRFLSYGAASASVIAECVGCIIMIVYVEVKHLVDIKRVFSISLKKWVAGIVMFLCVKVSNEICNTSVLGLTFLILEGTIIYIITLLVLRDEFFCNMIKKLFCKVKGILAH